MDFVGCSWIAGDCVVVDAGSEAEVNAVEAGRVDGHVRITDERTIVCGAAVSVGVEAADVERAVIAGLQLCCSRDADVPRKGAEQGVGYGIAGAEACGSPDVAERYIVAMIPNGWPPVLVQAVGREIGGVGGWRSK